MLENQSVLLGTTLKKVEWLWNHANSILDRSRRFPSNFYMLSQFLWLDFIPLFSSEAPDPSIITSDQLFQALLQKDSASISLAAHLLNQIKKYIKDERLQLSKIQKWIQAHLDQISIKEEEEQIIQMEEGDVESRRYIFERDLFLRVLIANILLDPLKVKNLQINEIFKNQAKVQKICLNLNKQAQKKEIKITLNPEMPVVEQPKKRQQINKKCSLLEQFDYANAFINQMNSGTWKQTNKQIEISEEEIEFYQKILQHSEQICQLHSIFVLESILVKLPEKFLRKEPDHPARYLYSELLILLSIFYAKVDAIYASQLYLKRWYNFCFFMVMKMKKNSIFIKIFLQKNMLSSNYYYQNIFLRQIYSDLMFVQAPNDFLFYFQLVKEILSNLRMKKPIQDQLDQIARVIEISAQWEWKDSSSQCTYYEVKLPSSYTFFLSLENQDLHNFDVKSVPEDKILRRFEEDPQKRQKKLIQSKQFEIDTEFYKKNLILQSRIRTGSLYYNLQYEQRYLTEERTQITLKEMNIAKVIQVYKNSFKNKKCILYLGKYVQGKEISNKIGQRVGFTKYLAKNIPQLQQQIQNHFSNYKVYLIINGSMFKQEEVLALKNINEISWISVFDSKGQWKIQYDFPIYKFNDFQSCLLEINSCIEDDNENQIYEDFPNICEVTRNSSLGVNIKLHKSKLNLIYMLCPYDKEQAKKDLIDFLEKYDVENSQKVEKSSKLENCNYTLKDLKRDLVNDDFRYKSAAITAYTAQSFVYKVINRSLRSLKEQKHLVYFRYLIAELYRVIQASYTRQRVKGQFSHQVQCFRICKITEKQRVFFQNSVGNFIQTEGFLSTSKKSTALNGFDGNCKIRIKIPELRSNSEIMIREGGFANITHKSEYVIEQQILFNPLNYFKIAKAQENGYMLHVDLEFIFFDQIQKKHTISHSLKEKQLIQYQSYIEQVKLRINNQGSLFQEQRNFEEYLEYNKLKLLKQIEFNKKYLNEHSDPLVKILEQKFSSQLKQIYEIFREQVASNKVMRQQIIKQVIFQEKYGVAPSQYFLRSLYLKNSLYSLSNGGLLEMHTFLMKVFAQNQTQIIKRACYQEKMKFFGITDIPNRLSHQGKIIETLILYTKWAFEEQFQEIISHYQSNFSQLELVGILIKQAFLLDMLNINKIALTAYKNSTKKQSIKIEKITSKIEQLKEKIKVCGKKGIEKQKVLSKISLQLNGIPLLCYILYYNSKYNEIVLQEKIIVDKKYETLDKKDQFFILSFLGKAYLKLSVNGFVYLEQAKKLLLQIWKDKKTIDDQEFVISQSHLIILDLIGKNSRIGLWFIEDLNSIFEEMEEYTELDFEVREFTEQKHRQFTQICLASNIHALEIEQYEMTKEKIKEFLQIQIVQRKNHFKFTPEEMQKISRAVDCIMQRLLEFSLEEQVFYWKKYYSFLLENSFYFVNKLSSQQFYERICAVIKKIRDLSDIIGQKQKSSDFNELFEQLTPNSTMKNSYWMKELVFKRQFCHLEKIIGDIKLFKEQSQKEFKKALQKPKNLRFFLENFAQMIKKNRIQQKISVITLKMLGQLLECIKAKEQKESNYEDLFLQFSSNQSFFVDDKAIFLISEAQENVKNRQDLAEIIKRINKRIYELQKLQEFSCRIEQILKREALNSCFAKMDEVLSKYEKLLETQQILDELATLSSKQQNKARSLTIDEKSLIFYHQKCKLINYQKGKIVDRIMKNIQQWEPIFSQKYRQIITNQQNIEMNLMKFKEIKELKEKFQNFLLRISSNFFVFHQKRDRFINQIIDCYEITNEVFQGVLVLGDCFERRGQLIDMRICYQVCLEVLRKKKSNILIDPQIYQRILKKIQEVCIIQRENLKLGRQVREISNQIDHIIKKISKKKVSRQSGLKLIDEMICCDELKPLEEGMDTQHLFQIVCEYKDLGSFMLGGNSSIALSRLLSLAIQLQNCNKNEYAIMFCRKVIQKCSKAPESIVTCHEMLAYTHSYECYLQMQNYHRAYQVSRDLVALYRQRHGNNYPRSIQVLQKHARICEMNGFLQEALQCVNECYQIQGQNSNRQELLNLYERQISQIAMRLDQ